MIASLATLVLVTGIAPLACRPVKRSSQDQAIEAAKQTLQAEAQKTPTFETAVAVAVIQTQQAQPTPLIAPVERTPTAALHPSPRPSPVSPPSVTPAPGRTTPAATPEQPWAEFLGTGIKLMLPTSYVGGEPDRDSLALGETLKALGHDSDPVTDVVRRNSSFFRFWGFDTNIGPSGVLSSVVVAAQELPRFIPVEVYMQGVASRLPGDFHVLEQRTTELGSITATRVISQLRIGGTDGRQLVYLLRSKGTVYGLMYSTGVDEFAERLPSFEQSARTFRVTP